MTLMMIIVELNRKKANESIVRSKFYTVDEFRLLLNDLNKKLTVLKAEQTTNKTF